MVLDHFCFDKILQYATSFCLTVDTFFDIFYHTILLKKGKKLNLLTDIEENLGQANQVEILLEIFENKKNGYFIEAGAHDGEYLSNTLYLEVRCFTILLGTVQFILH